MRIFIFQSETKQELRAFAGDMTGSKLPGRFGPWRLVRAAPLGVALPHRIARPGIERAILTDGFQLWRLKAEQAAS